MDDLLKAFPTSQTANFCRRWKIRELALFGSVLRTDFRQDIDILVTFDDVAEWGLLDHIGTQQKLRVLFGRKIDLVTKRAVQNSRDWIRRQEILNTASIIFPEK